MSDFIIPVITLLVGFAGGYLFYRKNGKRVEAKLAEAEAALAKLKS